MTVSPAHSRASGNPDKAGSPLSRGRADNTILLAGVALVADPDGALYWPEQGLLAVADLHLEKGSSFAARGVLLPPYDTAATLARLARLIARYAPRCVVALGDSFHDGGGPARLGRDDRENLSVLQRGRDWIWITGNHDPEPAADIGGVFQPTLDDRRLDLPPSAERRCRRNRRPSASGGARAPSRPRGQPALLCRGRNAHGDAGLRRLHRRAQCARRRLRRSVRHACLHRAYAGRRPALCLRRQALPAGLRCSR